jgi:hypothetical protein
MCVAMQDDYPAYLASTDPSDRVEPQISGGSTRFHRPTQTSDAGSRERLDRPPARPEGTHGLRIFRTKAGRWAYSCALCGTAEAELLVDGWRSWRAACQGLRIHFLGRQHQERV